MPGFNIFRKAKAHVENFANKVGSRILPPRETAQPGGGRPRPLPAELEGALGELGAATLRQSTVQPPAGPAFPLGTAARAEIAGAGPDSLAVSQDATGVIQWHAPHPTPAGGTEFRVWVRRRVREGREVVVKSLPQLPAGLSPREALVGLVTQVERGTKLPGIKAFPPEPLQIRDLQLVTIPAGGPAVLLIHGFFDRLFGFIFLPMFKKNKKEERLLLDFLHTRYPNRVFGYDHFTLSVDPLQNARDLLALLPKDLELDIICHSRGGLITRALLQHPEIREELSARNITIRKAVFVGAANMGTDLARPGELPKLLTIFSTLMLKHPERDLVPKETLQAMLTLLVAAARTVLSPALNALPGVRALMPDSDCVTALNQLPVQPETTCSFVRSDFGSGTMFPGIELARIANTVFHGAASDLVVPFEGAASLGPAGRAPAPGNVCDLHPADECNHLEFMLRERVQTFIRDRLEA